MGKPRVNGIRCPFCSRLLIELDESGCFADGAEPTPCAHFVAMIADGEWHGAADAAPIARVGRTLEHLLSGEGVSIASVLRGLGPALENPRALLIRARNDGGLDWGAFASRIPGAVEIANTWDGGSGGMSGASSFVFLPVRGRKGLIKRFVRAEHALQAQRPLAEASNA
jgi:hypothetical protein